MQLYTIYDPITFEISHCVMADVQPPNSTSALVTNQLYPLYDSVNDQIIEGATPEEVQAHEEAKMVEDEYAKYHKRKEDGVNAYLLISAEIRAAKLAGIINDEEHLIIEHTLEPVRAEVVLGQWIAGKQKLEAIGGSIIGQVMFEDLLHRITIYIENNY